MKKNVLNIILIIIIIGLLGFIGYDKIIKKDNVSEVNNEEKDNTEKKLTNLTNGEINYYLSIVPNALEIKLESPDGDIDAYNGEVMTTNNVVERVLYSKVYENTNETSERPENGTDGYDNSVEETIDNGGTVDKCVKVSDFKDNLYKMYNIKDKDVKEFSYPGGRVKKVGNYYCNTMGRGSESYVKFNELKSYEYNENNNDLIVYERVLILNSDDDFNNTNLYSDSSFKNAIANLNIKSYNDILNSKSDIMHNYEGTTFKHYFKQRSDGTYYWYSTELVK